MILALDREHSLYLFSSLAEAEERFEAIDVENGEYEFCDDFGQQYAPVTTEPITAFRPGRYALRPVAGKRDIAVPLSFADKAHTLESQVAGIKDLEALREHLTKPT